MLLLLQQAIQFARAIELRQFLIAADMRIADEYLRHRASSAASPQHRLAVGGIFVHFYFSYRHTFALQ